MSGMAFGNQAAAFIGTTFFGRFGLISHQNLATEGETTERIVRDRSTILLATNGREALSNAPPAEHSDNHPFDDMKADKDD